MAFDAQRLVRLVERHGANRTVSVAGPLEWERADTCDLLENTRDSIEVVHGRARINLHPYEIKTLQYRHDDRA